MPIGFGMTPHSLTRPFLFIDVQHGLGNRLRALASAAVIAARTDRQLVVIWHPDHHCQARMRDLFTYDGLIIEEDVSALMQARCRHSYNYMEIEAGSAFKAPVLAGDNVMQGDVYVRSAYTLKSPLTDPKLENQFMRALRPNSAVLDLIQTVAHPSDVAVHIRMATGPAFDHLSYESPENWPAARHEELRHWRQKSDIARFITRLDQMIKAGEVQSIFAAADLPASYAALIDRYGSRLRYLKRASYDRSAEQLQTAVADMMLLTTAPRALLSSWSSFSDVAQCLSRPDRRQEWSGVDF